MDSKDLGTVKYDENVTSVLSKDGVAKIVTATANQVHLQTYELVKNMGPSSWANRIIYNDYVSAVLIHQNPGEGNRTHYHEVEDEWWVVLKGEIKWWVEGTGTFIAKLGDVVLAPAGKQHRIKTVGTETSIRLAISTPDIPHFHPTADHAPEDF